MFTSGTHKKPTAIKGQPGQIATVILLVMGVILVVVLSLISRTTKEIEIAGQQQDSARVFNAAETGVEEALSKSENFVGSETKSGDVTGTPLDIDATYEVTAQSGLETKVNMGSSATVYLDGLSSDDIVNIYWAKEDCNYRASLLITVYYEEAGTTHAYYEAIRPNCSSYDTDNKAIGFSLATVENGGSELKQQYNLRLPVITGTFKMARIKALYADTDLLVAGVSTQAYDIRSEATDTSGTSSREKSAIKVTRTRPAPPLVLDYAVYSGGNLTK